MNIFISGIGGSGAYFIAKYFLELQENVAGSDLIESNNVQELLNSGARITINPHDLNHLENSNWDLYIYSSALPLNHPELNFFKDKNVKSVEVGEFTSELINNYSQNYLNENENSAFLNSNIAPLFKIDWSKRKYIGITGTDGKTTTSSMVYFILRKLGKKVAMLTTLGLTVNGQNIETGLHTTTPTSQETYKLLNSPEMEVIDYVVLEITSHAMAMGRVAGVKLDVAIITNITSEHLDYHKTWENYFNSKIKIFKNHLKENGTLVLNPKDISFKKIIKESENLNIKKVTSLIEDVNLNSEMQTEYNRQNASLAINAVKAILPETEIVSKTILLDFETVKGRMEYLQKEPFSVIVDFAHTANALEVLLSALKKRLSNGAKLRVVFGCAGQRDSGKRSPMGKVAAEYADAIYICPEDPRLEKLADINQEILAGMNLNMDSNQMQSERVSLVTTEGKNVEIFQKASVDSRAEAIKTAFNDCAPGDILAVCGKGHEKSLCFGTTEYDWSDQEYIKTLLK